MRERLRLNRGEYPHSGLVQQGAVRSYREFDLLVICADFSSQRQGGFGT